MEGLGVEQRRKLEGRKGKARRSANLTLRGLLVRAVLEEKERIQVQHRRRVRDEVSVAPELLDVACLVLRVLLQQLLQLFTFAALGPEVGDSFTRRLVSFRGLNWFDKRKVLLQRVG